MEKLGFDVGPDGVVRQYALDGEKLVVDTSQDISANVEHAKRLRNDEDYWRKGVKDSWAHALHIPAGVQMELYKIGVDIMRAPLKDIVSGLKRIDKLDACLATTKRIA